MRCSALRCSVTRLMSTAPTSARCSAVSRRPGGAVGAGPDGVGTAGVAVGRAGPGLGVRPAAAADGVTDGVTDGVADGVADGLVVGTGSGGVADADRAARDAVRATAALAARASARAKPGWAGIQGSF